MAQKDKRLYAQFTLDFADSHKIAPLSDSAFRSLVKMVLWSRRMLTDGRVPGRMATVLATPKALAELTSNDDDNPSLHKVGSDYYIHDFAEHQQTKEQIEARARVNTENGRRGGRPKANPERTEPVSESVSETEPSGQPTAKPAETQSTETETTSTDVEVSPRKRGTRIPEPFIVTGDMRAWAAESVPGLNVDLSTQKFTNYWRAKAGRDAAKLDWPATWRNWLLNDHERSVAPGPQRKTTAAERAHALTLKLRGEANADGSDIRALDGPRRG
jgi:hypothetical protein